MSLSSVGDKARNLEGTGNESCPLQMLANMVGHRRIALLYPGAIVKFDRLRCFRPQA